MKDLPNRHRNHEIETLSERYFQNFIPASWVVNLFRLDYGTDYNCEITVDNKVSGMNFSVQLKGKETELDKEFIKIILKRTTITRWLNRLEPTMIIAFIVDENKAFWIWVEEQTFDLTLKNDNYTIKIPRENQLSELNWDTVVNYVKVIFSRRHLLYKLPQINENNHNAWDLYFNREFDKALPLLYDLLKEKPNDIPTLEAIALSEYQIFNYQRALIYINKALDIDTNESLYLNKASILTEIGVSMNNFNKVEEAIVIYNMLINKNIKSYPLFYNMGSALAKLNQHEKSIEYFKKAIHINPNKPDVWNNLGNSYMNIGQHQLEMECYDNALMINPKMPETLFSKGSSLFRYFGKTDEGLDLMFKSADLTDRYELDNPYFFFWISEAYLDKNDLINSKKWNSRGLNFFSTDSYLQKQKQRIENKNAS